MTSFGGAQQQNQEGEGPQQPVVFGAIRKDVEQIMRQVCKKIFGGADKDYNQIVVAQMISQANEQCVRVLCDYNHNFKYIIKTMVVQNTKQTQAGQDKLENIQMSTQCYWNSSTDGQICLQYEDNPNMTVVMTLFCCAL